MKQPDTAALRERLANYTPEDELEQDKQELEGLELHGIHGSLKHTVQRERTAFNALVAAKDSADNIVNGINRAIVKAEQHTVIRAEIGTDEMEKVHQCTVQHIKAEKELLEKHSVKMAKHLQSNKGIWLSTYWFTFFVIIQFIFCLAVGIWAWLK